MARIPKDTSTFKYYNANPKNRKTGDCVIRAISKATGMSWDETLDGLVESSHKHKYCIASPEGFGRYLESLGWEKQKQPREYDNTKLTGEAFCWYLTRKYKDRKDKPSVVANIGGHHTTCFVYSDDIRYKCLDTWDCTYKCVGNFWVKD